MCLSKEPRSIKSFISGRLKGNLRIVIFAPLIAMGGSTAFTRAPSLSRASTIGELSSIRRPIGATIRSIIEITDWLLLKLMG